jgi:hypothetical protein
MGSRSLLLESRFGEKTFVSAGFLLQCKSHLNGYLLQGVRHAVGKTLYSRADRIGLNEASWLLGGLGKNVSFDLFLVDVARVLANPTLELVVPLEQELERFADDIGRICADELGVSVQVVSDFFLQANLEGCSLWLFGWCLQ